MGAYNPASLLSKKGLNTLLFSDPYAKLCCTAAFAGRGNAIYIDLDTTFSAYLKAGIINAENVDVYVPSEGQFVDMLSQALAKMQGRSLVVVDSINSFYALHYSYFRKNERAGGNLNHLLSVFLMLLVRQGVSLGVPVLATSMLRFRKEGGWKQSPASRRLLQKKSAVRMEAGRAGDSVTLKVLAHESVSEGTEIEITALR